MPISVRSERGASRLTAPLRALVRSALALEGRRPGEIAIVLADDATLRDLNRRWRGIDRATDVLSFEYGDAHTRPRHRAAPVRSATPRLRDAPPRAKASPPVNGDLVISLDRMRDQARRYRVSQGRELARLVIHGALHLAGLDHHRAAERRIMRAREGATLRMARAEIVRLDRALT
jgi:probable rRNA maturation factor